MIAINGPVFALIVLAVLGLTLWWLHRTAPAAEKHQCPSCAQRFTRVHQLLAHQRSHQAVHRG